ncbi:STAS domain-containing protein [Smaragdicoccus niigatensis]|uniref:STAS domain-containing protein n=1 Tax=Smaragdicoccus niigatensis TaxID=359359 RepID=UPI00037C5058|nr:STAS domain-containing protein [Smaragdicoccus niigatensis]
MTENQPTDVGLWTEQSVVRDALVLKVSGYIDLSTAEVLENALANVLNDLQTLLVVDLSEVEFLGSAGLTILARTHQRLAAPQRMAIVANNIAARPLEITGLDKVLSVYEDFDDVPLSI